ncbi:VOC family protein [Paenibacillus sp. FSL W8-0186]|uniref:VOC family protein n=1 Tax=Paenibacillus woosongensis TaxID=307580 RepID=A0ABQ4MSU7_9BACL|nr:VOC family protein [Paenibacillus woosongensis]GIP59024.1 VOC family protein [Paenibacillus woosongensis]
MAKHTTYILSEDARSQAEFYTNALGGEVLSIMTYGQLPDSNDAIKDKVVHLSLVAGGVNFFMTDAFEPIQTGNNINLSLEFATEDEAREAFTKLSEGGKVKHPLEPAFWGALHGQLEDKFGVLWMISNEVKQN